MILFIVFSGGIGRLAAGHGGDLQVLDSWKIYPGDVVCPRNGAKPFIGAGRQGSTPAACAPRRDVPTKVTLILSCLTDDAVYQVSDRRLTSFSAPHAPIDEDTNKALLVDGRLAFGTPGFPR